MIRYIVNCITLPDGKKRWRCFENSNQIGEDFKNAKDAWEFLNLYKILMR